MEALGDRLSATEGSARSSEHAVPVERVEAAERVESLDALRGLMALSVAVYHLAVWTRALSGAARDAVVILGVYSVEGFFLISGFCFFHLYAGQVFGWRELRSFHIKRFFRIAPLYYCAIVLGVIFALDQTVGPRVTPMRVVENVTLAFGLIHPNHSMVIGGWSIGLEYVFYLALPALLWVTRSRTALYALTFALLLWAIPYNFGIVQGAAEPRKFHAYVQIPNHAFLFLVGAVIADLRKGLRVRLPWPVLCLALAVIASLAALTQPHFDEHLEVMVGVTRVKYAATCSLVVLLMAFTKLPTLGTFRPLARLGDLSYSVYLMHPFAWQLLSPHLSADGPALVHMLQGLCAVLALSAFTWRVVEVPCNALGRRLSRSSWAPNI